MSLPSLSLSFPSFLDSSLLPSAETEVSFKHKVLNVDICAFGAGQYCFLGFCTAGANSATQSKIS